MSEPTPPRFDLTPAQVTESGKQISARLQDGLKRILRSVQSSEHATFANTIQQLAHMDNEYDKDIQVLSMLQNNSPDKDVRDAAAPAIQATIKAYSDILQNQDVFHRVQSAMATDQTSLDGEAQRLTTKVFNMFTDHGIHLSPTDRAKAQQLMDRLIELRMAFMDNIARDPGGVWMSEEDLAGLSHAKLESLEKDAAGRRFVSFRAPDVRAVLGQCEKAATRKAVWLQSEQVGTKNACIFKEILLLRQERAHLLGYPSHAAKQLEDKMAKTPTNVRDLLWGLKEGLLPLVNKEMETMKATSGDKDAVMMWDREYYHQRMLREREVNQDRIAEYFPADHTIAVMMAIFQELFAIRIDRVEQPRPEHVWHPDVKMFAVHDNDGDRFLGYLYTDTYPRPGKFNHAANFNIWPSFTDREGNRQIAATSLICNVTKASQDFPALLQHSEVVTIFHELGHGIHDILGTSRYAKFHGHRTVRDFTEMPSQLLEYWCWTTDVLQRMSCHYSYLSDEFKSAWEHVSTKGGTVVPQPPKRISVDLVHNLQASKHVNGATAAMRQVALSLFDLQVHDSQSREELEAMDPQTIYYTLLEDLIQVKGTKNVSDMGHGYVTTAHFVWGSEMNYYSYVQTKMFAADIWHTRFSSDPMDKATALEYRRKVLDKGGSEDESTLIPGFLGRQPNGNAYMAEIEGKSG